MIFIPPDSELLALGFIKTSSFLNASHALNGNLAHCKIYQDSFRALPILLEQILIFFFTHTLKKTTSGRLDL